MIINTGISATTRRQSQPSQPSKSGGSNWADVLPGALGTAGGIAGNFLGGAADVATAGIATPLVNPITGGAALGGVGQGVGDILKNLIQGKGFNAGETLSNVGQGAAYGAIPGGPEMRALPVVGKLAGNFLGREALRAGTGAVGGTAAQVAANAGGQGNQNPLATGAMTGALNAVAPGLPNLLKGAGKTVSWAGGRAAHMGQNVLQRESKAETDALQHIFGREAVATDKGLTVKNPEYQAFWDKHQIPQPPHNGNILDVKPALEGAGSNIEEQLKPLLTNVSVPKNFIKTIFDKNATIRLGKDALKTPEYVHITNQLNSIKGNPTLYDVRNLRKELGNLVDFKTATPTQFDKFGRQVYKEMDTLIQDNLDKPGVFAKLSDADAQKYKALMREHKINIDMKNNIQDLLNKSGPLPTEVTSKQMGIDKQMQNLLSQERMISLAMTAGAGSLGMFAPLPPQVKGVLDAIAAASFVPAAFPHTYPAISKGLNMAGGGMQAPANSQALMRILQQLGIRLPGMSNQNQ